MLMQHKTCLVTGVANQRSIAWSIAQALDHAGARLALSYLGNREKQGIDKIVGSLRQPPLLIPCDVSRDDSIQAASELLGNELGQIDALVHSIAFAHRENLEGRFLDTDRAGYQLALEISAYSLNALIRGTEKLMGDGSSVVSMTYLGSIRAIPNYNVMGVAKAALESGIRYLASELGTNGIRVNGLSAGPVKTLAARGIRGFSKMLETHAERAALKRNVTLEEIGNAALFLCSNLSSGITGEVIYVDAGYRFMGS